MNKRSLILIILTMMIGSTFAANASSDNKKLNILFILADDLGWSDVTLYGQTRYYETPNLERLAARGLTFTNAYSASPLCSPTRASILTGQTPARNGFTAPHGHLGEAVLEASCPAKSSPDKKTIDCKSVSRLNTELPTMVKLIKGQGYSTGHFGKWHCGHEPYSPLEHGFDVDVPHWPGPGPAGSFVAPWKFPNFKANYPNEHIEDRMADEAIAWLRTLDGEQPFYMNYWQFSVHAPFNAKESLVKYYQSKTDLTDLQHSPTYAAMVHSLDQAVGRLLDEIDRLGKEDNTAIIFYSDNGGNMYDGLIDSLPNGEKYLTTATNNSPLRGGKATMYEGGVRVPCIVVWPGLTEAGAVTDARIQSTDFYPTILNQLGVKLPKNHKLDGVDMSSALKGEDQDRGPMFTYFPHSPKVPDWLPPAVSVHDGDWKLIRIFHYGEGDKHDYKLYNLKWDIGETNNLAQQYPEKVEELDQLIEAHLIDSKAVVPNMNPAFKPEKFKPEQIGIRPGGVKNRKKIVIE